MTVTIKVITVDSEKELKTVLKALETDPDRLFDEASQDEEVDVLEQAKRLAGMYLEDFLPFSYDDVGLTYEKRHYRAQFSEWALQQNIEYRRSKSGPMPGSFKAVLFYPFHLDDNGQKIFAQHPEEKDS